MIVTKSSPFTHDEIISLREQFDSYIKTVIDVEKKFVPLGVIGILNQKNCY